MDYLAPKKLTELMVMYCQPDPKEHTSEKFKLEHKFFLNKANLRDLIAATGLVILLKLDSNRRFFSRETPNLG